MDNNKISLSFVSAACNRLSQCIAWSREANIICYPADKNILLAEIVTEEKETYGKAIASLVGHTSRVTCLKWMSGSSSPLDHEAYFAKETTLVSGASDKTVRVWELNQSNFSAKEGNTPHWQWPMSVSPWSLSATLEGHTGTVTQIDTLSVLNFPSSWLNLNKESTPSSNSEIASSSSSTSTSTSTSTHLNIKLIASTSTDGTVRIWCNTSQSSTSAWTCIQTINFGTKYMESLSFTLLPGSKIPVLATGGVDKKVHIFVWDGAQTQQFVKLYSLQGHEDWIRSVSFANAPILLPSTSPENTSANTETTETTETTTTTTAAALTPCLFLASAAQDSLVRIWRIETNINNFDKDGNRVTTINDAFLEALLTGHDDHVYTVNWQPPEPVSTNDAETQVICGNVTQPLAVLTASMDRTMMIWRPEAESGVWMNEVRVGEFGGSGLGFYGSVLGPHGTAILAHSFQGALHLWMKGSDNSGLWSAQPVVSGHFGSVEDLDWDPTGELLLTASCDQTSRVFANWRRKQTGSEKYISSWHEIARPQIHGYDMQCISTAGSFRFVSGADEKVIRVFDATEHFRETLETIIGRDALDGSDKPSDHNDDDAATLSAASVRKAQIARRRHLLSDQTWKITSHGSSIDPLAARGRALGATVPALGLTNKAVFVDDLGNTGRAVAPPENADEFKNTGKGKGKSGAGGGGGGGEDEEGGSGGATLDEREAPPGYSFRHEKVTGPPLEEHLMQNTLWPESQKLYGHGNELFCSAVTYSSNQSTDPKLPYIGSKHRLTASACKASKPENATIRVWDLDTWKEISVLSAHTLTVTQLSFSHNDRYLLSVSRDRQWALFERVEEFKFKLVAKVNAHERIIWSGSWSHDDKYFATASRDKLIKIWGQDNTSSWKLALTINSFDESVTAVDWAPISYPCGSNGYLLAVGLDNGLVNTVQLIKNADGNLSVGAVETFDKSICHNGTVRRIRFRPFPVVRDSDDKVILQIATCGTDNSVRLFDLVL